MYLTVTFSLFQLRIKFLVVTLPNVVYVAFRTFIFSFRVVHQTTKLGQLLLILLLYSMSGLLGIARAVGLPDTGLDTCYNDTGLDIVSAVSTSSVASDTGTHPRQDCIVGRDAANIAGQLTKIGGGTKGRDYSKIANTGAILPSSAVLGSNPTDWSCTLDNITGLMWEVKAASGLRSMNNTYTWYNINTVTNGGNAGTANGGACSGGSGCDTEKFVKDVNNLQLCGYSDWRMPSKRELFTLRVMDGSNPAIDSSYFPNTLASVYWSGSSYVPNPAVAWNVYFSYGYPNFNNKSLAYYLRLVRGGQF